MTSTTASQNSSVLAGSKKAAMGSSIQAANEASFRMIANSPQEAAEAINKKPIKWWQMRKLKAEEIRAPAWMKWVKPLYALGGVILCSALVGAVIFTAFLFMVLSPRFAHVFAILTQIGWDVTFALGVIVFIECAVVAKVLLKGLVTFPEWGMVEITDNEDRLYLEVPGLVVPSIPMELFVPPRVWQCRKQVRAVYPEARSFIEYSDSDPFLIITDKDKKQALRLEHWMQ